EKRQELVDAFQAGKLAVLLCGITAANAGMTLTRARDMLVVELPWSPMVALQCEGRIHRIGQNQGVIVRYLIAVGTLDETLWRLLVTKTRHAAHAIDGARDAIAFTADDLAGGVVMRDVLRSLLEELWADMTPPANDRAA